MGHGSKLFPQVISEIQSLQDVAIHTLFPIRYRTGWRTADSKRCSS
ncbi:unnamed protein product [Acanthoscelides obtectus]|uniref:Uncharacterized protein n=1 Tax=Acanthoscelides obtectus TaxID=200917 RepID=A0A9P0PEC2_ACAOB|nr:unnamed protein product [Acanthoscelides obtectus]CAK1637732.1 hypothetical protein AOBTE_LOCUS10161 [Acanthoscelides obtectus]